MRLPSPLFWIGCLCLFLGISLQVQTTLLHDFDMYKGLRLCFADIALPIAGLGIIVSLLRQRSVWPIWSVSHFYLWIGGLAMIFIAAYFQTHAVFDAWSRWALTNKLPGILVVCAYACLGGWLGTNAGEKNIVVLFRCLIGFMIIMMLAETAGIFYQDMFKGGGYGIWPDYPLKGLMDNRNAYGLFALMMYSVMLCFAMDEKNVIPKPIVLIATAILPYFLIEIGSRAILIAVPVMLAALAFLYRKRLIPYIGAAVFGGILILAAYTAMPGKLLLFSQNQLDVVQRVGDIATQPDGLNSVSQDMAYMGDSFRLKILDISFRMIGERPLFGSGLGSSFIVQQQERNRYDIIESTPIWLWVETGLFGLLAFGAFYFLCMKAIVKNMKGDDFHASLSRGIGVALLMFTIITCMHEMLMTRQAWFLLGLALAIPVSHIRKRQGV